MKPQRIDLELTRAQVVKFCRVIKHLDVGEPTGTQTLSIGQGADGRVSVRSPDTNQEWRIGVRGGSW